MTFHIITIFPKILDSYFNESLFRRAKKLGIVEIKMHNLRDYTDDRRRTVDDRPFGGGPGMVLKFEPIARAVGSILKNHKSQITNHKQITIPKHSKSKTRIILFSTRGKKLDEKTAQRLSKYDNLILICGRYEGVDERVAKYIADEEISIGDYVLSGGELPAAVLAETVSRKIKGFLGKHSSLEEIKGSYPVYTRPEVLTLGKKKLKVPRVLLKGNHKEINEWRHLERRQ